MSALAAGQEWDLLHICQGSEIWNCLLKKLASGAIRWKHRPVTEQWGRCILYTLLVLHTMPGGIHAKIITLYCWFAIALCIFWIQVLEELCITGRKCGSSGASARPNSNPCITKKKKEKRFSYYTYCLPIYGFPLYSPGVIFCKIRIIMSNVSVFLSAVVLSLPYQASCYPTQSRQAFCLC